MMTFKLTRKITTLIPVLLFSLTGCDNPTGFSEQASDTTSNTHGHSTPTLATKKINQAVYAQRPFSNTKDIQDAKKGLIAQEDNLNIHHLNGDKIWDMEEYGFVDKDGLNVPDSVNPSLWRQVALNNIHGLFKVSGGVYQLRGYDLANMSIIEGDTGWIIVDPLTSFETANRALKFAQQHLGKHPIKAVLFTHSHIDHFGGIDGILNEMSEAEKADLKIIAPKGFTEEATSENIIAGPAMSRRSMFMYGKRLGQSERGHIGTGIGKSPAFGTFGLSTPTHIIDEQTPSMMLDGIEFEFLFAPHSEAPANMVFYIPKYKAFNAADLVFRSLHNLYTLRGAKVRNAVSWSQFIEQARLRFKDTEVFYAGHTWPMWGNTKINEFLIKQRDAYKYLHDQSVRLLNAGLTPKEISEQLSLPENFNSDFYLQGYYGTVKHNAKAVYQSYMGWYTANPSQLNPLTEPEVALRYVRLAGGMDKLLITAQNEFTQADNQDPTESLKTYRWLAEVLNHAVFAEPENEQAKSLLAKIYDQLGYISESGPWRDVYLSGAYELRHGAPKKGIDPAIMKHVLGKTPVEKFFDSMAVRLNSEKAEGKTLNVKVTFTDLDESHLLMLNNSVLHHKQVTADTSADATLNLTQALFLKIIIGEAGLKETLFGDDLSIDGSTLDLISFFSLLDKPKGTFNIVTP